MPLLPWLSLRLLSNAVTSILYTTSLRSVEVYSAHSWLLGSRELCMDMLGFQFSAIISLSDESWLLGKLDMDMASFRLAISAS